MRVSMVRTERLRRLFRCGRTAAFLDTAGRPVVDSISEKTWVDVNGVKQGMVIRGLNVANRCCWSCTAGRACPTTS